MAAGSKKERFKKITAARTNKINDMLRLIGNCSNKNNYSYTDSEVLEMFDAIEKGIDEAKSKYEVFSRESGRKNFRHEFEHGYTWTAGFMRNVMRFPKRSALICPKTGRIWNYEELNGEVNRLANAMTAAGVKRGDKVMYQLNNCPEFVFIYAACHKIGAVGCPAYTGLAPAQTASIINIIEPKLFFYENSGDTELALTMTDCKPELIIVNFMKNRRLLEGHTVYEEFISGFNASEPSVSGRASIYDETTLFFTSGTTGRQKCVPVTDINEVLSAHDTMMQLGVKYSDRLLSLAPWSHRGGLHCSGPAAALYAGASITAMEMFEPSQALECIERYKVTFVSGMPSAFKSLADAQEKEDRNLGTLKKIISIGSMLSKEECLRYQRIICPDLYNGYGTTETFWNTILPPDKLSFYSGSVGTACTDDDVRVVKIYKDRDAEPEDLVERDGKSLGEIIIRTYSKSAGYYAGSNPGSGYYKGFLYTKDIGTWDEDGMITIAGRNDDMIICGDDKLYPEEIEEILNSNKKVADCIVTSVTDKSGNEVIAAYVVKADKSLDFEELDRFCLDSMLLPNNKRPRLYRFKKVLPCTSNGKKQHKRAKQMAANDVKNDMFYKVQEAHSE